MTKRKRCEHCGGLIPKARVAMMPKIRSCSHECAVVIVAEQRRAASLRAHRKRRAAEKEQRP